VAFRANPTNPTNSRLPRGFRNNNPGNIMAGSFTQRRPGYAGSDGRFARFNSMAEGVAAMDGLLNNYMRGGRRSVSQIIGRWAPPNENHTSSYIASVARAIGVDPNAPLTPGHIPALRDAMIRIENGRPLPRGR